MADLIVGTVSLATLGALEEVCFCSLSHCHLGVPYRFLSVLLPQLLHVFTGHFLEEEDEEEENTHMD